MIVGERGFGSGVGACAQLARSLDWSKTPLGPVSSWSAALRATANLVLCSSHPMFLLLGPELVQMYNDAFALIMPRGEYPGAIGQPCGQWRGSAWSVLGPQIVDAIRDAKPTWHEDQFVPIDAQAEIIERYWTYSCSPVFEADGSVAGALLVGQDTTDRVIANRRARTISSLSDDLVDLSVSSKAELATLAVLRTAPLDVPFAAVYVIGDEDHLELQGATVLDERIVRVAEDVARRHLERRRTNGDGPTTSVVDLLKPLELLDAPWPEALARAFIATLPKTSFGLPKKLFVFGLSPRLPFDGAYRTYLECVVRKVAEARTRIEAFELRARAESERRDLLRQAPVATVLFIGRERRIELANAAFVELAEQPEIAGKTFAEVFPELLGTEVDKILLETYESGKTCTGAEQRVLLRRGSTMVERWFNFNVQAIRDCDGSVYGLILLQVDITEAMLIRRALEEYATEREKLLASLETANRQKDEFLAMLGHELRNPLAPITTALHLMKMKQPDTLVREREIITRQTSYLVKLVDDLLDVARVARGKVTLHRSRVMLADVIGRVVEAVSPLLEQKQHTLTIEVPSHGLDVNGDSFRLSQVFANLLTNAAKYTEAGGRILIRATREGDSAVVSVEDNGIGIPPAMLPHVFESFFQGPRSQDRAQGGLGLGLSLVQSFVSLHGGSVSARSRAGGGSVFEVRIPALAEEAAPLFERRVEAPEATAEPSERKRILLVDDSEDILEVVSSLLRAHGYEVVVAHDAPAALQIAPSFHPNIAVLDIGLPVMDGYDLARHLREDLGENAPRMIAMTGYGQEDDRERARQAGFAVHLVKPVDPQVLLATIRG